MVENTVRTALLASLVALIVFFPALYGCALTGSPPVGGDRTATEEPSSAGPAAAHETEAAGAATMLDGGRSLQQRVFVVHPSPRNAEEQRSKMHDVGCQLDRSGTKSAECAFGDPSSETTVVLFGDSHAMLWFPALNEIAKERNWRLVGLTKSACPPAEVHRYIRSLGREYSECDAWRERTLERIIQKERPQMVVTSMNSNYQVMRDGKRLGRRAGVRTLEEGYVSTLEKLRSTGAEVVAINDIPHPDKDIPECVSRSRDHLQDCATPRGKALDYPEVNAGAAARARGAHFIDPTPLLCLERVCPAVIGDVLVYRNGAHLTPTYVRTLTPWLGKQLPELTG
jgi:SGNH domain (fused to AT3 domains)